MYVCTCFFRTSQHSILYTLVFLKETILIIIHDHARLVDESPREKRAMQDNHHMTFVCPFRLALLFSSLRSSPFSSFAS